MPKTTFLCLCVVLFPHFPFACGLAEHTRLPSEAGEAGEGEGGGATRTGGGEGGGGCRKVQRHGGLLYSKWTGENG